MQIHLNIEVRFAKTVKNIGNTKTRKWAPKIGPISAPSFTIPVRMKKISFKFDIEGNKTKAMTY